MFWQGAVRLTHNSSAGAAEKPISSLPRITFKELISGPWDRIILSSYCTDYEWVLDQFKGIGMGASVSGNVPITVISHYDRANEPAGIRIVQAVNPPSSSPSHSQARTLNIIYPPFPHFPNYGVMHCKLMLLFGAEYMRVVVSSGNLVDYDYDQVQNIVFVQDVPRKKTPSEAIQCQFQSALLSLLEALGAFKSSQVVQRSHIHHYDWSAVKVDLVYSLPGYVEASNPLASGLSMLNRLVVKRARVPAGEQGLTVEYQGSSLGSLNRDWIDAFLASARGCLCQRPEKCAPTFSSISKKRTIESATSEEPLVTTRHCDRLHIVFPKMSTVCASPARPEAFATLFCKERDFKAAVDASAKDNTPHPHEIFRDCVTDGKDGRADYAMHSKIMTVTEGTGDVGEDEKVSYRYIGSHNFTASAWGRLVKSGSKLMVCNYEVGVLFEDSDLGPVATSNGTIEKDTIDKDTIDKDTTSKDTTDKDTTDKDATDKDTTDKDTTNKDTKQPSQCSSFPYPYVRPAPAYRDADMPWCQDVKNSLYQAVSCSNVIKIED